MLKNLLNTFNDKTKSLKHNGPGDYYFHIDTMKDKFNRPLTASYKRRYLFGDVTNIESIYILNYNWSNKSIKGIPELAFLYYRNLLVKIPIYPHLKIKSKQIE